MDEAQGTLRLAIGPLRYEFRAHDAWGVNSLERLHEHVVRVDFAGPPDRVLHLANLGMSPDTKNQAEFGWLPDRFAELLAMEVPRQGWQCVGDDTGYLCFWRGDIQHALWLFGARPVDCQAPFQLPWPILLDDIVARGGGILHGGLIVLGERSYVVTAPQGGGKTTAIARLPADWRVLADDACLVWPGTRDFFVASPLPTWSVVLGLHAALPAIGRWHVGANVPIKGVILLGKGDYDRLDPLPAWRAVPMLYRALSEHPQVVANRGPRRAQLLDTACELSKTVATWHLIATLRGRFWECLPSEIDHSPRLTECSCLSEGEAYETFRALLRVEKDLQVECG